jgi:hypothetical protein
VQEETRTLEGADAEEVERWVEEVVMRKKRDDAPKQGEEVGGSSEASGRAA